MKRKTKILLMLCTFLILFGLLLNNTRAMDSKPNTSSVSDYTAYLSNNGIDVIDDKYNLFQSVATSSNEYRNIYDTTEFLLESTDNYAYSYYNSSTSNKYQLQQSYYEIDENNSYKGGIYYDRESTNRFYSDNINVNNGTLMENNSLEYSDLQYKTIESEQKDIYTFESDTIGSEGTDISYTDEYYATGGTPYTKVINGKSMNVYDCDMANNVNIRHNIVPTYAFDFSFDVKPYHINSGIMYIGITNKTDWNYWSATTGGWIMFIHDYQIAFRWTGGNIYTGMFVQANVWNHIQLTAKPNYVGILRCNTSTPSEITTGVLPYFEDYPPTLLTNIHIGTHWALGFMMDYKFDNMIINTDIYNYENITTDITVEGITDQPSMRAYINDTINYNATYDFTGQDYMRWNEIPFVEQFDLYTNEGTFPDISNASILPTYNGKQSVLEIYRKQGFIDSAHYLGKTRKGSISFNISFTAGKDFQGIGISDIVDLRKQTYDDPVNRRGIYLTYIDSFSVLYAQYKNPVRDFGSYLDYAVISPNAWQDIRIDYDLSIGWNTTINGTLCTSNRQNQSFLGNPDYLQWFEIMPYTDDTSIYIDDIVFDIELIPNIYNIYVYDFIDTQYDLITSENNEYIDISTNYLSATNILRLLIQVEWNKTFYHKIDELSVYPSLYGDRKYIYNEHEFNAKSLGNDFERKFLINTTFNDTNIMYQVHWYYNSSIFYDSIVYSVNINETFESIELQTHIRHGLSTLTPYNQSYTCILFKIILFYDLSDIYNNTEFAYYFDFKDYTYNEIFLNGSLFTSEGLTIPNYSPDLNCGYMKISGFIASYNSLYGVRLLKGSNVYDYNRFFEVPLFIEPIFRIFESPVMSDGSDDNPDLTENYWTGIAWQTKDDVAYNTTVGNWSIEFTPIKAETYYYKWYYSKLDNTDGNIFTSIIGAIWIIGQFVFYCIGYIIIYVFTWLLAHILLVLWNICLYYIYIGICWIGWMLLEFLFWLWSVILWIWTNIIYPILKWLYYNLLPAILEAVIIIIASVIASLIWLLMLGTVDWTEIYDLTYIWLWLIVDFIVELFITFANNIVYIMYFLLWYLLTLGMSYVAYAVERAKGNMNNAKRLYYTLTFLLSPIMFIYNILKKILDITPEL